MKNSAKGPRSSEAGMAFQDDVSKDGAQLQQEMQAVLAYLAVEFRKQLQYADRELSQAQDLLRDAIETLTTCFLGIHRNVQAVIEGVGNAIEARGEAGQLETVLKISDQLQTDLHTAIRTLQFQDLTFQLIDHAMHRVSAMNDALSDIQSGLEEERGDTARFVGHLCRHKESILKRVANLDEHKTNPVAQGHMGVGDIELF
jgi:cysteinyl-tRNA synthetase